MLTLNQLKQYLIQFFENHLQVNRVIYADDFDFAAVTDVDYRVVNIQPVDPATITDLEILNRFKIIIGDIEDPNNPDSENDIWSDCLSIANDFLNYFGNDDFEDFYIDKNVTIQRFSESQADRIAGVVFAFNVRQTRLNNPCTLPILNPLTGITFTGAISYSNGYYNLLEPYLKADEAALLYEPLGSGQTVDLSDYYTIEQADGKFLTGYTVDFSNYYSKEISDGKYLSTGFSVDLSGYQLKGDYLTGITSNQVTGALGYTPISAVTIDLSGYQLKGNYVSASTLNWYQLAGDYVSASTLNNYYSKVESDAKYLTGYTVSLQNHSAGTGLSGTSYNGSSGSTWSVDQTFTPTWTGFHNFTNKIGINSSGATHSLTFGSTSTGIVSYNTVDQTTNYLRFRNFFDVNGTYTMVGQVNGTVTVSPPVFFGSSNQTGIGIDVSGFAGGINSSKITSLVGGTGVINGAGLISNQATLTAAAGMQNVFGITPTVQQSGSAGFRTLLLSPYILTGGTGTQYLIDAGLNTLSAGTGSHNTKFQVDISGNTTLSGSIKSLAPAYTGGTYSYLVRNNTTGRIESQTGLTEFQQAGTDANLTAYNLLGGGYKLQAFGTNLSDISATNTVVSTQMRFMALNPVATSTVMSGVTFYLNNQGVYTANNENSISLYSYAGGVLTKVATTGNVPALWSASANTLVNVSFTNPYTAAPGVYFLGMLFCASSTTTAPILGCNVGALNVAVGTGQFTNSAKLFGTMLSQTAAQTTIAMSGISATTSKIWAGIY